MNENRYTLVIEGDYPLLSSDMTVYIDSDGEERQFGGKVMEFYHSDALEKIGQLEDRNKLLEKVTEAAKFLLEVKNHKDTYGKTSWYLASKPIAWRKLEEALKNYGELEGL